jgi:hypothetical protein
MGRCNTKQESNRNMSEVLETREDSTLSILGTVPKMNNVCQTHTHDPLHASSTSGVEGPDLLTHIIMRYEDSRGGIDIVPMGKQSYPPTALLTIKHIVQVRVDWNI